MSVAAVITTVVAALGLKTWKKQLKGHSEYELARRLLRAAFKTRNAIRYVRTPLMTAAELSSTEEGSGSPPTGTASPTRSRGEVYSNRRRTLDEAAIDLRVEELEGEVLWGNAIEAQFTPLRECVRDLTLVIWEYCDDRYRGELEQVERIDRVLRAQSHDDEFDEKVNAAVAKIEAFLGPRLGRR